MTISSVDASAITYGYICTNCGMGWDGKYIDNLNDKSCPDCNGELEFRKNIEEI